MTTLSVDESPARDFDQDVMSNREAFPKLNDEQLTQLGKYATCRTLEDGEILFEQGDRDVPLFIIEKGNLEVFERTTKGERSIATHDRGNFTGELGMISNTPAMANCRCIGTTQLLAVDVESLKRLVSEIPQVGDVIVRAWMQRRALLESHGLAGMQIIGSRWNSKTFELRDFLGRHGVLFRYSDADQDPEADAIMRQFNIGPKDLPVMLCGTNGICRNPNLEDLATRLGLRASVDAKLFDLIVIGGGPGGLAAAVYGASEGLSTLVIEARAPGGQAGTSSRIENYLGFPLGLSGADLTERAVIQAQRFGSTISSPATVKKLECDGVHKILTLDDGQKVAARAVVIATGARYRKLPAEGIDRFESNGVYYGATHLEAVSCRDSDVTVVGGGNSAGQAAVFLSETAACVRLIIRGDNLSRTMSRYLIDRIENSSKINLITCTQVDAVDGEDHLEGITLKHSDGTTERVPCQGLFVMIGAEPNTAWLDDCVGLDDHGFVVTGNDARSHPVRDKMWTVPREPYYLESTRPGVFAVGDVRAGSVKRVASAVGEGSMAVKYVHDHINA